MSVLIEGMQMPEKCGLCDLFHAESPMHCTVVKGHKTVGAPYGMPRPDWCPLVEVPTPVSDLIDRQAAIDAIRKSASEFSGFMEMEMYTDDDAVEAINGVPSAETVRHGKWIPCGERIPEVGRWVLCQCRAGIMNVLRLTVDGSWEKSHPRTEYMSGFVVAWMPLPEPYEVNHE